jgi:hypothetical protein
VGDFSLQKPAAHTGNGDTEALGDSGTESNRVEAFVMVTNLLSVTSFGGQL